MIRQFRIWLRPLDSGARQRPAPTGACTRRRGIEATLNRAFLAAYLLAGNPRSAESALMEAIDSWDPDEDTEEGLFQRVLSAAVRTPMEPLSELPGSLPMELQALFRLPQELRRAFVLRFLVGLPVPACSRLLRLSCREVDERTCAALRRPSSEALFATGISVDWLKT